FFSSRRRHTRSKRDWSSDVCSSDLFLFLCLVLCFLFLRWQCSLFLLFRDAAQPDKCIFQLLQCCSKDFSFLFDEDDDNNDDDDRSEERRVGKECRLWWWSA